MEDFSNSLFEPYILQRGLLLDVDGKIVGFPYIGFESMVNDVLDWDVVGARIYTLPFQNLALPRISKLEFGFTAIADFDPQQQYTSRDERPPKNNPASDTVSLFGIDAGLPVLESDEMEITTYVDWAIISGKGMGVSLGSGFRRDWLKLMTEVQLLGREFLPNYFDPFYWVERSSKYDSLDTLHDAHVGYAVGTELNLGNVVVYYFSWEDSFSKLIDPRIRTGISPVQDAFEKFDFSLTYDKKGIDSFKDFTNLNDSLLEVLLTYRVTEFASIVLVQKQTFSTAGKSVSATSVETTFLF
jgi:hypothetical protein